MPPAISRAAKKYLTALIQPPPRGREAMAPEKVPASKKMTLMPREKTKVSQKPRKTFPDWLIQERRAMSTGPTQGAAMIADTPPTIMAPRNSLLWPAEALAEIQAGTVMENSPARLRPMTMKMAAMAVTTTGFWKEMPISEPVLAAITPSMRIDQGEAQDEEQGEDEALQLAPLAAAAHEAHDDGDDRVDAGGQAGQEPGGEHQQEEQERGAAHAAADEVFQAAPQRLAAAGCRNPGRMKIRSDLDLDPALIGRIAEFVGIFLADLVGDVEVQLERGPDGLQGFQQDADADITLEDRFLPVGNARRENGFFQGDGIVRCD